MIRPLAVALYSLQRETSRDFQGVLERIAEIGYSGIELDGLNGLPAEEVRHLVDELGLTVTSSQVDLDPTAKDFERVLEEQQVVGNKLLITDFGPEHYATRESLAKAAADFNALAGMVRERGMTLGYHNHWWEFTPSRIGRLPILELVRMLDEDVFLEVDLYYIATAWFETRANEPVAALASIADRARLIHVKDGPCTRAGSVDSGVDVAGIILDPSTAVGSGKVDIPGMLSVASLAEWHIVETDVSTKNVMDAMADSYAYLIREGLSYGRVE